MGYLIGTLYATMIVAVFLVYIIYRRSNLRAEYKALKETNEKLKKQQEEEVAFTKKLLAQQEEIEKGIADACKKREAAQQRAAEAQSATEQLLQSEQRRLAAEMKSKKELEEVRFEQEKEKRQEAINLYFNKLNTQAETIYKQKKEELQTEITLLQSQLNEWKSKQEAINQEIQRQQELEDSINFHRIQLKESDKSDIHFLLSIEDNINNKDLLHKLIWTEYIQRPFNQMINSTFGSKIPKNVIYCIENINTHKKYIGKTSAEVSKRWTDHIKNSLNIGTIKRQNIHDALYNHWDEFTFTVLEEVKDDKLGEREKFYINFFQTDKYGFNIKSGG